MSGGHFDYAQHHIGDIADEIDNLIAAGEYSSNAEILARFKLAVRCLRKACIMAERIDYLVSGDDDDESFMERWEAEMEALEKAFAP